MIQCHGWDTLAVFLRRQTDAQTDEPTTFIHKAEKCYCIRAPIALGENRLVGSIIIVIE